MTCSRKGGGGDVTQGPHIGSAWGMGGDIWRGPDCHDKASFYRMEDGLSCLGVTLIVKDEICC